MAQVGVVVEGPLQYREAQPSVNKAIIPRDIRFGISANPKRHWNGGDPIRTMMVDGLSIFLPEGERFFIRSLKHYATSIEGQDLARELQEFAVQEAYHTREHEDYNRAMEALGYDVKKMEDPVRQALEINKLPLMRLAATCAIEHLTATLARSTLRHPDTLAKAEPHYRRLWVWHALEELEHKAVALDVFQVATKNMARWKRYLLRVMSMNGVAVSFLFIYLRNIALYARHDGIKTGPRFWAKFAYALFVKPGLYTYSALPFLKYYLPGFNPRKGDDSKVIAQARAWLANDMSGQNQPVQNASEQNASASTTITPATAHL